MIALFISGVLLYVVASLLEKLFPPRCGIVDCHLVLGHDGDHDWLR